MKQSNTDKVVENAFGKISQLEKGKIFGVLTSTYNGWNKTENFPDYVGIILDLYEQVAEYKEHSETLEREKTKTSQVDYESKILLIKNNEVIATCNDKKHADYICDFIC